MKAETLETYRPLLRDILSIEGFQFQNVFAFRVKDENIVDALSGKSQFFDIGTKGNKLLKTLFLKWRATQRPSSIALKDHIMSIFLIQEDAGGTDFLGVLRERVDGEMNPREEGLVQLVCSNFAVPGQAALASDTAAAAPAAAPPADMEKLQGMLEQERQKHQAELERAFAKTQQIEENLRVAEENVTSFQRMAEQLQETVMREQQMRQRLQDEAKRRETDVDLRMRDLLKVGGGGQAAEARVAKVEHERQELAARLKAAEAQTAELRQTLERIEEERSADRLQQSNEIDMLMGNLSQLQVREQELLMQIDTIERDRGTIRRQLEEAQTGAGAEAASLRHQLDAARNELAAAGAAVGEVRELRDRVAGLEEEIRRVRAEITRLEQDLASEREVSGMLRGELESVEGERNSLSLEKELLGAQVTELMKENERVQELQESLQQMGPRLQEATDLLGTITRSREKYRQIVDSHANPTFLLDRNLTVLHLNRAMLGLTRQRQFRDLIGRRCYEALGLPGICPGCPILTAFESGRVEQNTVPMNIANRARKLFVSAYPTADPSGGVGLVTESLDERTESLAVIDRLRAAEDERRRLMSQVEASPVMYLQALIDSLGTETKAEPEPDS
ncbi:MAG: PAS domain-containing protein [Acidobacteriota bacterium]